MGRAFREIMCKENINSNHNNGALIPEGKPYRMTSGVIGNNTTATALTDEEIVELSKYNEGACVNGRSEYDHYYQIKFVGEFCLDNRCYAIIRPCMCVLGYENGKTSITTAQFSVMNSITRLITRVKKDKVDYATVYRIENDGRKVEVKTFDDLEQLVIYIQSDKKGYEIAETDATESSGDNVGDWGETDNYSEDNSKTEQELREKIRILEQELSKKDARLEEIEEELDSMKDENKKLNTIIEMIKRIIG